MTNPGSRAVTAYSSLDVETGIAGASPQKLVLMLYDGALKAIFDAKVAMARSEIPLKGSAISKAIAIIDEGLRPALDMNAGGEIAANLMALYDYISGRLLYANIKNDSHSLDESARLLSELRAAWETLDQRSRVAPQVPVTAPQPRAPVSFGKV
ncbi:MAG TPA: flagellar export chaperone FliS [Burkholderiales bacterium]|nr:flagellar export chaperone FliS [Burkholderiales bacterium]